MSYNLSFISGDTKEDKRIPYLVKLKVYFFIVDVMCSNSTALNVTETAIRKQH